MHRTRVFISSTCFDLAPIRESLAKHITQLGHHPVLSEESSFPVRPDEDAITNCRQNVERHCDIFVLIVGGRRGCVEPSTGKSVTNLEYIEAMAVGKPCFVFIKRAIWDSLPIFERNPNGDFSTHVDSSEVFEFVQSLRATNRWIFPFERTDEIEDVLSIQISGLLRDLLERKNIGTLTPLAAFSGESELARKLAHDRPRFWEFMLSAELLRHKLSRVRAEYSRIKECRTYVPSKLISGREFFAWIADQFENSQTLSLILKNQVQSYAECWGPPGTPGDPTEILDATNSLVALAEQVPEWERSIRSVRTHPMFDTLRGHLSGVLESILSELEKLPVELLKPFSDGGIPPDGTVIDVSLKLESPSLDSFTAEIARLRQAHSLDPASFTGAWTDRS